MPIGQILPFTFFANNVLLEHSHAHLFTRCLWLLSCFNEELSSYNSGHMVCKAQNIYCLAFCGENADFG